ncbi:unnamed protein product, partial [Staurois parvus]
MRPHTDPGPSGSARVSKWSVRPWYINEKASWLCLPHRLKNPSPPLPMKLASKHILYNQTVFFFILS